MNVMKVMERMISVYDAHLFTLMSIYSSSTLLLNTFDSLTNYSLMVYNHGVLYTFLSYIIMYPLSSTLTRLPFPRVYYWVSFSTCFWYHFNMCHKVLIYFGDSYSTNFHFFGCILSWLPFSTSSHTIPIPVSSQTLCFWHFEFNCNIKLFHQPCNFRFSPSISLTLKPESLAGG
ncbi:hypothetical protein HN873_058661 [Arachis hypogaea]